MILEEETFEVYGYYPSTLKPQSNKLILAVCELCDEIRILRRGAYRYLCISCCQKDKMHSKKARANIRKALKGKNNPNWKGGLAKCICEHCSETFYTKQREIKNGNGIYCSLSCSAKVHKGEKAFNWRGGISFEPYCVKFNNEYKRKIRARFSNVCFLCNKTEAQNGRALDVHHVNYNKKCGCDDTKCICVPLCMKCHAKTNGRREYWERKIKNKLRETLLGY